MKEHNCDAPICALDKNPNFKKELVWYVGEKVCTHLPLTKFQKKQINFNNLLKIGKIKNSKKVYNAKMLEI